MILKLLGQSATSPDADDENLRRQEDRQRQEDIQRQLELLNQRMDAWASSIAMIADIKFHLLQVQQSLRTSLLGSEDRERDLIALSVPKTDSLSTAVKIVTDHPVAIHSDDHRFPRGTQADNTRHPRFVAACAGLFERPIRHLDLGCAGGGLVWDFVVNGHQSYGVEGSDFSLLEKRAEWRTIPERLFTADITQPFSLKTGQGEDLKFDVISAWEVLEHIPDDRLDGLIENVRNLLSPEGIFVASVALFEDKDPNTGAVWHVTLKPKDWWIQRFERLGLVNVTSPFAARDYVRGSDNPRSLWDWNGETNPDMGFHIVLRRAR